VSGRAPTNADRVREVLRRLGEADFDGTGELLADDFVQEYPYVPMVGAPARIEGVEPFLDFVRPGMTAFEPYRYTIEELFETTDPAVVVAEYTSHSRLLASGAPYSNRYIGVFRFADDGRLALWREYLNPQVIAEVFGP
jgi:ketosteroid isomerase-like protein